MTALYNELMIRRNHRKCEDCLRVLEIDEFKNLSSGRNNNIRCRFCLETRKPTQTSKENIKQIIKLMKKTPKVINEIILDYAKDIEITTMADIAKSKMNKDFSDNITRSITPLLKNCRRHLIEICFEYDDMVMLLFNNNSLSNMIEIYYDEKLEKEITVDIYRKSLITDRNCYMVLKKNLLSISPKRWTKGVYLKINFSEDIDDMTRVVFKDYLEFFYSNMNDILIKDMMRYLPATSIAEQVIIQKLAQLFFNKSQ